MGEQSSKRGSFGSHFGTIAAVGGSVVGLGNIWRFPYLAGENGGSAFLLVYILVSLAVSIPIMLSEFVIGRHANKNAKGAFQTISNNLFWKNFGFLGIATAFFIFSFYAVIAGWALEFLRCSVLNSFKGMSSVEITQYFTSFTSSGYLPLIWTWLFIACTSFVVIKGVSKGIERVNKVLMPLLVLILISLAIYSSTLDNASLGYSFLFHPDFSKIDSKTLLAALGQSFFSMSLGMGAMITYGSYIKKDENLYNIACTVSITDTSVAILCGLAIFPAVFSFGINPTSGPELIFITLPNVFQKIYGGYFIGIMFFVLVFFAAITSTMSLLEVVTSYVSEELKMSRKKATMHIMVALLFMSMLCVLSQMPDSVLTIGGKDLVDFFDSLSANFMLPIGGFFIVVFVGWLLDSTILKAQLTTNGKYNNKFLYSSVRFLVKFIAPVSIALLFLSFIGFL